ncbi:MAG: uracil-DNA glycosylase [Alphaproteobacteria bacterium]|nr:uracil-DNA glycosylase [Alphaproteobacteria bacterium]
MKTLVEYSFPEVVAEWNGIVLVGEAPGAEEVRLGKPFVGRSGKLLDKMLANAGIEREKTIIANVFRYRPPANKVGEFFISAKKSETEKIKIAKQYGKLGGQFCKAEFVGELKNLAKMLKKKKPRIAVALGRTALWGLTGKDTLKDSLGKITDSRLCEGVRVLATYHPSFILRGNWKLEDEWAEHFRLIVKISLAKRKHKL